MTPREKFNQLPRKAQEKIIENNLHINVHHDWWDSTYDDFKLSMSACGFDVDDIRFTGFCSQGDGASFDGRVDDWSLFNESERLGLSEVQLNHINNEGSLVVSRSNSRYSHSNTMRASLDLRVPYNEDDEDFAAVFCSYDDELRQAVFLSDLCQLDVASLEESITDALRGYADDLYADLEREYFYLISEEAILETMISNEMLEDEIDSITMEHDHA